MSTPWKKADGSKNKENTYSVDGWKDGVDGWNDGEEQHHRGVKQTEVMTEKQG